MNLIFNFAFILFCLVLKVPEPFSQRVSWSREEFKLDLCKPFLLLSPRGKHTSWSSLLFLSALDIAKLALLSNSNPISSLLDSSETQISFCSKRSVEVRKRIQEVELQMNKQKLVLWKILMLRTHIYYWDIWNHYEVHKELIA